jgi:hypothetical protein
MDDAWEVNSAFSTKATAWYAKGKKSSTDATVQALLEENQRLRDESSCKMGEMEAKFLEMLYSKYE